MKKDSFLSFVIEQSSAIPMLFPSAVLAHADSNYEHRHMMNWDGGIDTMGGLWWMFMPLLLIITVVGTAVLLGRLINQSISENADKSALDILKRRYANGEIDKKEFEEKKKDLI